MKVALVGNPDNRRVHFHRQALEAMGHPPPEIVSWRELLAGAALEATFARADLVRIESFGEDSEVERGLLRWGAEAPGGWPRCTPKMLDALSDDDDPGLVLFPSQRHAGLMAALARIASALEASATPAMTPPEAIGAMFDKARSHALMARAGVRQPTRLQGAVRDYDSLRAQMEAEGLRRVFIKLRYSSSASGVVAYQTAGERELAISPTEIVRSPSGETRLYNTLRMQRYRDRATIKVLLDALCREDVVVERWVPKAASQEGVYDLRFVVIAGRTRHGVMRCSEQPMTNLHLGNRRGDIEALRRQLGATTWRATREHAELALSAFDGAHCGGVDVALSTQGGGAVVFEVNAFGDLLPRVTHEGDDTYRAEYRAWERACTEA